VAERVQAARDAVEMQVDSRAQVGALRAAEGPAHKALPTSSNHSGAVPGGGYEGAAMADGAATRCLQGPVSSCCQPMDRRAALECFWKAGDCDNAPGDWKHRRE
jgi:hypothetical protein